MQISVTRVRLALRPWVYSFVDYAQLMFTKKQSGDPGANCNAGDRLKTNILLADGCVRVESMLYSNFVQELFEIG